MSRTYQIHTLVGTVGAAPRAFTTQTQRSGVSFPLAVNERNAGGQEVTTWYTITCWNGLGQACGTRRPGDQVLVTGKHLKGSSWTNQQGDLCAGLELWADRVVFLQGQNGYQQHVLVGHLGGDPTWREISPDKGVANFDLAINSLRADGSEDTLWVRIAAWNELGAVCADHLAKGRYVMVTGTRLKASAWTTREDEVRVTLELSADDVIFLDAPLAQDTQEAATGEGHRAPAAAPRQVVPMPARQATAQGKMAARQAAPTPRSTTASRRTTRQSPVRQAVVEQDAEFDEVFF